MSEPTVEDWDITATQVEKEAGGIPLNSLGFTDQADEDSYVTAILVPAAVSAINSFLKRSYTEDDVPPAVLHVGIVVAANALRKIAVNKKGGLIQSSQWNVELSNPTIFTPELKTEIASFIAPNQVQIGSTSYQTDDIQDTWGE